MAKRKPKVIGRPGQGTHSRGEGPDNWQSDNAEDIALPVGTPIYAVADGVIDPKRYGDTGAGGRFAGMRVTLISAGNSFYYAHLSQLVVRPGAKVKKGQLIGYSGEANGVAHLHFASRRQDPAKWTVLTINGGTIEKVPVRIAPPEKAQPVEQVDIPDLAAPPGPGLAEQGQELPGTAEIPYEQMPVVELWRLVYSQPFVSPETERIASRFSDGGS